MKNQTGEYPPNQASAGTDVSLDAAGISADEIYWQNCFSEPWSVLELPFQRKNRPGNVARSRVPEGLETLELPLDADLIRRLPDFARRHKVSPGELALGAWLMLLEQITGEDEFFVGVASRGTRVLPVRFRLNPESSFSLHLKTVHDATCEVQRHGDFPFEALAGENGIDLFGEQKGLVRLFFSDGDVVNFPGDLRLSGQHGVATSIRLTFDRDKFHGDAIRRHCTHLAHILSKALQSPEQSISTFDLLPDSERFMILSEFNRASTDYPRKSRVEDLFHEQAAANPDRVAVVHQATTLTYKELDEQATRLARVLRNDGVAPGEVVAILMYREAAMVAATLAVLKAGGIYLPIDPSYPGDRIAYMLADSRARRMIVSNDPARDLAGSAWKGSAGTTEVLYADRDTRIVRASQLIESDDLPLSMGASQCGAPAQQAAYLMYTSGTTGKPKGVLVPHRGIVRLVRGIDYVQLDAGTRMLQAGAIGFDATTFEMWGALLNGGSLHIVDRNVLIDAVEFEQFLKVTGTNTALLTTSLFSQLAEQNPRLFTPLHQLVVGGDALSAKHVRLVQEACPSLQIINAYGPTENSVISTAHVISAPVSETVPIGRPISNSSAYIVSRYGKLLPIGVPGELYVGGDGVGLGYLNRPELTGQCFIQNPFGQTGVIYRTGDFARWRTDGSIEFLGRRDQQVKIRGFRVETGEIEARLRGYAGVHDAVVLAKQHPGAAARHLCAYVVADQGLSIDALKEQLAQALPDHMVPKYVVCIPAIPVTANGKLDRSRLPEPVISASSQPDAQRCDVADDTTLTLVRIWEEVLGVANISVHQNLQSLGGDSLTATMLSGRIEKALGLRCPVALILTSTSIAELGAQLRKQASAKTAPSVHDLPRCERRPFFALSPQQRQIYVEQMKDVSQTHYNLPIVVDVPNAIDLDRLTKALQDLAGRHEILRTEFIQHEDQTYQRVKPDVAVPILRIAPELGKEAALAEFVKPFDLEKAPLWRVAVMRGEKSTRIMLDMHHIIMDGFSLAILLQEWSAIYRGDTLPAVDRQYADYAEWIAGPEGANLRAQQRKFWASTLGDLGPLPDLPTDFPRADPRSIEGDQITFDFGAERTAALRDLARARQVTVYQVLLAIYGMFLARVLGHQDIVVGTPVSGRHLRGTERIVGMFVNTVCVRLRLDPEARFNTYLRGVAESALAAIEHQDYPFEQIVAEFGGRTGYSRNPVFDTMFALQNTDLNRTSFLGGMARWLPGATARTIFDLNLQIDDLPKTFLATWIYAKKLFRPVTMEFFRDQLLSMVDAVIADNNLSLDTVPAANQDTTAAVPEIDFTF